MSRAGAERSPRHPHGEAGSGSETAGESGGGRPALIGGPAARTEQQQQQQPQHHPQYRPQHQHQQQAAVGKGAEESVSSVPSGMKQSPPPPRGKRKLDGVLWTFGAADSGERARAPPPLTSGAAHGTSGSGSGSGSGNSGDGGGKRGPPASRGGGAQVCGAPPPAKTTGGLGFPAEPPAPGRNGNSESSPPPVGRAGGAGAFASSSPTFLAATPGHRHRQQESRQRQPRSDDDDPSSSSRRGHGAGGGGPSKRRHASGGSSSGGEAGATGSFRAGRRSFAVSAPRQAGRNVEEEEEEEEGEEEKGTFPPAGSFRQSEGVSPPSDLTAVQGAAVGTPPNSQPQPGDKPAAAATAVDGATEAGGRALPPAALGRHPPRPMARPSASRDDTAAVRLLRGVGVARSAPSAERTMPTVAGQMESPDGDRLQQSRCLEKEQGFGEDAALDGRCPVLS